MQSVTEYNAHTNIWRNPHRHTECMTESDTDSNSVQDQTSHPGAVSQQTLPALQPCHDFKMLTPQNSFKQMWSYIAYICDSLVHRYMRYLKRLLPFFFFSSGQNNFESVLPGKTILLLLLLLGINFIMVTCNFVNLCHVNEEKTRRNREYGLSFFGKIKLTLGVASRFSCCCVMHIRKKYFF